MMEWLDFFMQQLVTAVAWCLAVVVVGGVTVAGICAALNLAGRGPVRRARR